MQNEFKMIFNECHFDPNNIHKKVETPRILMEI